MPASPPIFLAGPTAVGKSAVALRLAHELGGEIISVDSMQVYRGMDIGTAKPSLSERAQIPHHLIDVVEVTETFDAAQFTKLARAARQEIQARGNVPIFCGGTGLYFKAFLEGVGETPKADAALRERLESVPLPELLSELERTDPALYQSIDRQNRRRVVRALEVIRQTGRPFSEQRPAWRKQASQDDQPGAESHFFFGLARSRDDLRQRIDMRVDEMFATGLVAETERLLAQGLEGNPTAMQALGYRQVVEYLQGARSLPETIELVKIRTRQFAKRQMTWFRWQATTRWIELAPGEGPEPATRQIMDAYRAGQQQ